MSLPRGTFRIVLWRFKEASVILVTKARLFKLNLTKKYNNVQVKITLA